MSSRPLALATLFGAAILAATPASAFSLIGWNWAGQNAPMAEPFLVNHTSFPNSAGTSANVRAALFNGMDRWGQDGESQFSFNYGGTTTQTSFTHGDAHIAQFKGGAIPGPTLAVAQSWGFAATMFDCDIEFYASNDFGPIQWSSNPSGAGGSAMDLEQIATHEFGHCAGLDHSSDSGAMMFSTASPGGGPSDRTLHPDDIAGMQAMYGAAVGADLELSVFGTFAAGASIDVVVSGAANNATVWLAGSPSGEGDGPCLASLGGECAGLLAPISAVANQSASAAGEAVFTITVPPGFGNRTVGLQAVVLQGNAPAMLSNVFEGVVAP